MRDSGEYGAAARRERTVQGTLDVTDRASAERHDTAERSAGIRRCLLILVLALLANAAMWALAPSEGYRTAVVIITFLAVSLLSGVLAGYLFYRRRRSRTTSRTAASRR